MTTSSKRVGWANVPGGKSKSRLLNLVDSWVSRGAAGGGWTTPLGVLLQLTLFFFLRSSASFFQQPLLVNQLVQLKLFKKLKTRPSYSSLTLPTFAYINTRVTKTKCLFEETMCEHLAFLRDKKKKTSFVVAWSRIWTKFSSLFTILENIFKLSKTKKKTIKNFDRVCFEEVARIIALLYSNNEPQRTRLLAC